MSWRKEKVEGTTLMNVESRLYLYLELLLVHFQASILCISYWNSGIWFSNSFHP